MTIFRRGQLNMECNTVRKSDRKSSHEESSFLSYARSVSRFGLNSFIHVEIINIYAEALPILDLLIIIKTATDAKILSLGTNWIV